MSFIAGAGTTNVDLLYQDMPKIPDVGEEIYTDKFSIQLGGGLPATLINLGRLGVPTRIATELGTDMFSSFASEQFGLAGVSPLNLYNGNGIPLNVTSAIILKDDRSFITYGKGDFKPDDKAKESFYQMATGAKICLMSPGGFLDVYRKLKVEGTVLVLDTGWDETMSLESYSDVLEVADYYTPNRKEACKLTGCDDPIDAAEKLKGYFDRVIVKVDKDGCIGIDEDGAFFIESAAQFANVDSTGAGDAFLAGFCYGLYYDRTFRECIAFGNVTGGKAVTKAGALSAYVSESELLELSCSLKIKDL